MKAIEKSKKALPTRKQLAAPSTKLQGAPRVSHDPQAERWRNALPEPVDHTLLFDVPSDLYDFKRPLYRCSACLDFGEKSLHRYVDECPSFDD